MHVMLLVDSIANYRSFQAADPRVIIAVVHSSVNATW